MVSVKLPVPEQTTHHSMPQQGWEVIQQLSYRWRKLQKLQREREANCGKCKKKIIEYYGSLINVSELCLRYFLLLKRNGCCHSPGNIFVQPLLSWMPCLPCVQHAVAGSHAVDKDVTHFHRWISLAQRIYILFNFTPILFAQLHSITVILGEF